MSIVGGFDVHRRQITFDYLDTDSGQLLRGRIAPACRAVLRRWLTQRFAGRTDVEFAVEACTGWRFVVEELELAGIAASLAEPADTAAARGRKQRAKTDLLTELWGGSVSSVRQLEVGAVTFPGHDRREGRRAGSVPVGGRAARVA